MSPLEQEAAIAMMQYGLVYDYSERFVHLYACGQSLFTGKERDSESGLDNFGGGWSTLKFVSRFRCGALRLLRGAVRL